MNEYKGTPYARMHAHGYRCGRQDIRGGPLYSIAIQLNLIFLRP